MARSLEPLKKLKQRFARCECEFVGGERLVPNVFANLHFLVLTTYFRIATSTNETKAGSYAPRYSSASTKTGPRCG
jgi:hypothetical protein